MRARMQSSARKRNGLIRGLLGVALGAVALGAAVFGAAVLNPALAATARVGAIAVNPPPANFLSDALAINRATRNPSGNPLWAIPQRSLSSTRERPLFSPSRRPPPPAVIAAPSVPPPAPPPKPAEADRLRLKLVGTIVGDDQSIGIFVDQLKKDVVRLRIGEGHDGWTLRAIDGREATFEKDRRETSVTLPARNSTDPSAASIGALFPVPTQPPGTWRDGDGQLISPPPQQQQQQQQQQQTGAPGPQRATWRDGDGRLITPPREPR